MIRLDRSRHGAALELYRTAARFPLIGAVLLDRQDGVVYVDNVERPAQAYVEHAFGFAQVLGRPAPSFEACLERYLLTDKRFAAAKVRLYAPTVPSFLDGPGAASMRSSRQRFVIGRAALPLHDDPLPAGVELVTVDDRNVGAFEQVFGVTRRFWRSTTDFVQGAAAAGVLLDGRPASICYAAAEADGEAEIDVLTSPAHRRRGLAKVATMAFVRACFARGCLPLWDCFSNNLASIGLCRSIGFAPKAPPYDFFTIAR
jgi:RimJ/RimL family protein N-acetyltransferase